MATAVRVSEELVANAKKFSQIDHRSVAGQIDHWARMGKLVEESPDLTYSLIKEILIGLEELEHGEKTEYRFGYAVQFRVHRFPASVNGQCFLTPRYHV